MARARLIKPGFFTNEELCELAPLTRLLFAGLWTIADRLGRLEDRPKRIQAQVLPYDKANVERMLGDLAKAGFIERYESGGDRYIQVLAFAKHQHVHQREPASSIPAPARPGAMPRPSTGLAPADVGTDPAEAEALNLNPLTEAEAEAEEDAHPAAAGSGAVLSSSSAGLDPEQAKVLGLALRKLNGLRDVDPEQTRYELEVLVQDYAIAELEETLGDLREANLKPFPTPWRDILLRRYGPPLRKRHIPAMVSRCPWCGVSPIHEDREAMLACKQRHVESMAPERER